MEHHISTSTTRSLQPPQIFKGELKIGTLNDGKLFDITLKIKKKFKAPKQHKKSKHNSQQNHESKQ